MAKKSRRGWLRRAGQVAVFLLALFIMLRWFEHRQTYHPTRSFNSGAADLGRPWEDVHFAASDGVKLHAWFFPANTNSPRAHQAFVICHGNGGNISHRLHLCELLLRTGVNVLAFDYRGYGHSEGRPGEEGTYRDAQAAYAWLRQRGVAATSIVAYGESLGGGVASELAVRETLGGLVLQSSFTSVTDLGAELYPFLPVRTLGSIRYDTRSKLPRIHVPVLILHSRADGLIPFQHAERNFDAANDPKWLWEIGGNHNDGLDDREKFTSGIEQLLSRLAVSR